MDIAQQIELSGMARLETDEATARDALFAGLVDRQSRFVYRVAYGLLRNSHDAEDAVQETFLNLYRTGAWERMRDEKAFLARTVWRIALDRIRDRAPEGGTDEVEEPAAADALGPEAMAIAADHDAWVHRLVDSLPEQLRRPLVLSSLGELNSREIGELMGISEGTVRTRLQRARHLLKEKMSGGGPSGSQDGSKGGSK